MIFLRCNDGIFKIFMESIYIRWWILYIKYELAKLRYLNNAIYMFETLKKSCYIT